MPNPRTEPTLFARPYEWYFFGWLFWLRFAIRPHHTQFITSGWTLEKMTGETRLIDLGFGNALLVKTEDGYILSIPVGGNHGRS